MSQSIYEITFPVFIHMLNNLSAILEKASSHAETKKIDPSVFIQARLAPDMFPMVRQVQICCDIAKSCAARLADIEIPSFPDTETDFSGLHMRVQKTISFLNGIHSDQIKGSEDRVISMKTGPQELRFTGREYVHLFVLPNFYFHLSMAYANLRHCGVEIGKKDFLGKIQ